MAEIPLVLSRVGASAKEAVRSPEGRERWDGDYGVGVAVGAMASGSAGVA